MRERLNRLNVWQRLGVVLTIGWLALAPIYVAINTDDQEYGFFYWWLIGLAAYTIMAVIVWGLIYIVIFAVRWIWAGRKTP